MLLGSLCYNPVEMPSSEPIRVAIVEDDQLTRDGLALLIGGSPGYRCVGRFASLEQALAISNSDPVDVFLLDIHLPGMSGSEGVALLRERFYSAQVVMLTVFAEREKVFESICNGACGYLLKKTPPARLLDGIREAHEGGAPMTPEIARKVVSLFQEMRPKNEHHHLTGQEVRLLSLFAEGHSYQASASRMRISVNTVRNYIRSIYEKLHVHSKSAAVTAALRRGVIR
jgi:DNA-binding NarL/FixJ family response regulator